MSQGSSRQSPTQPPVSTSSNNMTLVHNGPTLPTMNGYTGQVNSHGPGQFNLPPILEPSPQVSLDTALPSMKLPPRDLARSHASTVLSITSLLSRNPESPRGSTSLHQ